MTPEALRNVLEAAMLAAGRALSLDDFLVLFEGSAEAPDRESLREALDALGESLAERPLELVQVASGYRLQVRQEYSLWLGGLFSERPPRYSRALLETLALIAYRQPVTRGEIEEVRGVAVSSNIIKTLMEREWIRVLGHREVPGRPALYGTTREFLDHFGLRGLDGLPGLAEIRDLDQIEPDLFSALPHAAQEAGEETGEVAGEEAGAEAGDDAGEEANVETGEVAGEEAGAGTGEDAGEEADAEIGKAAGEEVDPEIGNDVEEDADAESGEEDHVALARGVSGTTHDDGSGVDESDDGGSSRGA